MGFCGDELNGRCLRSGSFGEVRWVVILWFEVVDEALAGGDKRVDRPEIALRPTSRYSADSPTRQANARAIYPPRRRASTQPPSVTSPHPPPTFVAFHPSLVCIDIFSGAHLPSAVRPAVPLRSPAACLSTPSLRTSQGLWRCRGHGVFGSQALALALCASKGCFSIRRGCCELGCGPAVHGLVSSRVRVRAALCQRRKAREGGSSSLRYRCEGNFFGESS